MGATATGAGSSLGDRELRLPTCWYLYGYRCGVGGSRGRVAGGKICEIKANPPESGTQMRRGEVYWAQLVPRSGSEQRGRRPVIVVSHDGFNQTPAWRSIIVVPISTAAVQAQRGPTAVGLAAGAGGLPKQSIAICHQVTTLDKAKLVQRIGILDSQLLNLIDNGLKAALQLP